MAAVLLSITALAMSPQDDRSQKRSAATGQTALQIEDESMPDSVDKARWKVQRTVPVEVADLDSSALDLKRPENIKQQVDYNDSLNYYLIGSKMGEAFLNTPVLMSPEEYMKWSELKERYAFFRKKVSENVQAQGKEKFSFADMHFDLGPAEKIFGPGGVRIKTQGTAELKLGATLKNIDNPSLPERNRKTSAVDFDEKINLNVSGKVGDKMNMNLNYNTDATFDFDTKNLKLRYEGKEDEIIKLVEAGNVTFPSNNSLVKGASSLFGVRTDMQFGKLKLQTVLSQKNSTTKSVASKGGTQLTPFELNVANYEENRHFFLSRYFRERYDAAMQQLPNLTTGVNITRVEVWVTNKTGTTSNTRNIVAFADLGESTAPERCQQRVRPADVGLRHRPRHRPDQHGAHHPLRGRRGLREAGCRPPAEQFGIYGEQGPGLYLPAHHAADRPGAGRSLRVHLRRPDLPCGRVCLRPYQRLGSHLRESPEEHQQQSHPAQLALDDEERLLSGIKRREAEVPPRHQDTERHGRCLYQLYPRAADQEHHPAARTGLRPSGQ